MLVGIDKDGMPTMLLANQAFHDVTGHKRDVIGQSVYEFVEAARHKFIRKQLEKMLKYAQPVEFTLWAKVPAGHRAFEVEMIPVLNRKKEVREVIVIINDITNLVKLQEEVRTLRAANYTSDQA